MSALKTKVASYLGGDNGQKYGAELQAEIRRPQISVQERRRAVNGIVSKTKASTSRSQVSTHALLSTYGPGVGNGDRWTVTAAPGPPKIVGVSVRKKVELFVLCSMATMTGCEARCWNSRPELDGALVVMTLLRPNASSR